MIKKYVILLRNVIIVLTISLFSIYLGDGMVHAYEQINSNLPVVGSQDNSSGNRTKVMNDPYFDILKVIKNFFYHRFDADKTQSLTSISKKYKARISELKTMDYTMLKSGLEERSRRMTLLALDEFKITELEIKDNFAKARVEFLQRVKNNLDGKIIQTKHIGDVFLEKEGSWKITEIIDLRRHNSAGNNGFLNEQLIK